MTDTDAPADAALQADTLPDDERLSPIEARILGCLIEKEATTPEQYPLTENSLALACNQKTSREPVMDLSTGEVGHALRMLESRRLVRSQHASRAQRWGHRFSNFYGLTSQQQGVLCVLMLRGAQTVNELLTRTERISRFEDAEQLRHALERLVQRSPALVVQLPRAPGQREERWTHLLSGPVDIAALQASAPRAPSASSGTALAALEARVTALEEQLAAMEARLPAQPHLPEA